MRLPVSLTDAVAQLRARVAAAGEKVRSRVSHINVRLTRRAGSPRVLIGYLGLVTTAVTMLAPPITYAVFSTLQLYQRAEEQATLGARHIEVQLPRQERRGLAQSGLHLGSARHPPIPRRRGCELGHRQ